jgi:Ca-activated chloride channel family protein
MYQRIPTAFLTALVLSSCGATMSADKYESDDDQAAAEPSHRKAKRKASAKAGKRGPRMARPAREEARADAPASPSMIIGTAGSTGSTGGLAGQGRGASGYGMGVGEMGTTTHRKMAAPTDRFVALVIPERSTEEFTDHGVNPFTIVADDSKSTFSIDVDTASYTITRKKLNGRVLPPWEAVRVEEFLNYFDYTYESPVEGPFAVHMDAMPDPYRKGHHVMRVGVQAKRYTAAERPPLHLTFLADVSGSMSAKDKLPLAKEAMHTLVDNLREGDTVALATYAGRVARILEPTSASNARRIHSAIDSLNSGGSTAMSSGIDIAYGMAMESFERGAENRVVILSDGDANVGRSSWDAMLSQIKGYADKGVTLSTIGLGQGNYRDTLMEQLANKGDGNNFYIDSKKEAEKIFGEKIGGTMITVARDVKIQVEFNPESVSAYRLLGYENRDIADADFRNDKVDAGEVGSGHSVTALYEVVLKEGYTEELATVRLRYEKPGADGIAKEIAVPFDDSALAETVNQASASMQLAYAAATFAEVLRQSPHAAEVPLAELEAMVRKASKHEDATELAGLIATANQLGATQNQSEWVADNG